MLLQPAVSSSLKSELGLKIAVTEKKNTEKKEFTANCKVYYFSSKRKKGRTFAFSGDFFLKLSLLVCKHKEVAESES